MRRLPKHCRGCRDRHATQANPDDDGAPVPASCRVTLLTFLLLQHPTRSLIVRLRQLIERLDLEEAAELGAVRGGFLDQSLQLVKLLARDLWQLTPRLRLLLFTELRSYFLDVFIVVIAAEVYIRREAEQ